MEKGSYSITAQPLEETGEEEIEEGANIEEENMFNFF